MTNKQSFPNNLRSLRIKTGLLQSDVAKALGLVSSDRISHWENGVAVPSVINLFKLSVLYQVPPQELYGEMFGGIEEAMTVPVRRFGGHRQTL